MESQSQDHFIEGKYIMSSEMAILLAKRVIIRKRMRYMKCIKMEHNVFFKAKITL